MHSFGGTRRSEKYKGGLVLFKGLLEGHLAVTQELASKARKTLVRKNSRSRSGLHTGARRTTHRTVHVAAWPPHSARSAPSNAPAFCSAPSIKREQRVILRPPFVF
ncbi:hypothetical protein GGTG_13484 [Gaeumannomyces tritici R3-111a-1]|uniref:Uncharacterized protein n=1 Tax=Gaeumannomyces tritici (strain R3-111a-1) TaxID=644352 RepID=J3PJ02_GAET3|nr:hypothetical protein GGTG_13484 [Gaeumannomyces tritici R3-111a-1]EJT68978.1 hypothetical protein GGTG_13484 [Gaeumannomyces tritici R3-111a-1]